MLNLGFIQRWRPRTYTNPLSPTISQSLSLTSIAVDHGHTATVLNIPGIVAYYPLDSISPTNATTAGGTSGAPALTYHGTSNTLQSGAGSHTGSSTDFNPAGGASGTSYATVTDNIFDFSNTFTLTAFIRLSNPPRDSAYSVIASGSYTSGPTLVTDYALYAEGPGGVFQFAVSGVSGGTVTVDSTTVPVMDAWYLIQVTYDGAFINMYVNGVLENQTAQTALLATPTDRTFSVGGLADGSQLFPGSIDDVAAFNSALSPAELGTILSTAGDSKVRLTQSTIETLTTKAPKARLTQSTIEALTTKTPKVRLTQSTIEALTTKTPKARLTQSIIEVLRSVYTILDQYINQSISLSQSASTNNILTKTSTQSLILTQALRYPPFILTQTLSFTTTATTTITHTIHQSLSFNQFTSLSLINQHLTLAQTLNLNVIYNRTNNQSLSLIQLASILHTTTQSLTFNQLTTNSLIRHIRSSLIFNQTVTYNLKLIVNQSLFFISRASFNTRRSRTLTQSLTFIEGYNKPLPINLFPITVNIGTPPISITQLPIVPNILIEPHAVNHNIFIPSASYVVISANKPCTFILGAADLSVVLPCPLFGDSQGFTSTTSIKRTMTGGYFTYNKITQLQKLSYTFNIFKNKMYEVRNFLIKYMSSIIFVQNHKSELWLCYVTNNPVKFVSKSRWGSPCPNEGNEKVEFTLELSGARLL